MKLTGFLFCLSILTFSSLTFATENINLENGLVISRPETLRSLENKGYSLSSLLRRSTEPTIESNLELSKLSEFKPIYENIREELKLDLYGVGRRFDMKYLESANSRFVLVGVVNRMDRGYAIQNRCGEIRFIYRLAYRVMDHDKPVFSRLPMTINLIFKAGADSSNEHCADLASSWMKMDPTAKSDEWINNGPLSEKFFRRSNLKSLEINLQAERQGAGAKGGFGGHAVYLLKVYDWNNGKFEETTLENQIDREMLLKDPKLLNEFKTWLLNPQKMKAIDEGTLIIPQKFLAKRALSIAPGGLARSSNRPYFDLIKSTDVEENLFKGLENVKSINGLLRRLNDTTCTGCHQTRAIGGFHFTGVDPSGKYPGNSVFLPGSPHFLGDLSRRYAVLQETSRNLKDIDYSRGFSARPQERRSLSLKNTGLLNGWGAHCAAGNDPSFKEWSCAGDLICKPLLDHSDDSGMGICINPVQKVGDPCEFGVTKTTAFGVDQFKRIGKRTVTVPNAMCSPQSQDPGTKTGGFLNGNIRKNSCEDGPGESGLPPEAACGPLPAARPGFNACIGKKNFDDCLKEFSTGVGLRFCDQTNPCRDDYICAESFKQDRGVCVPPYFLFQFRVDGHPLLEKSKQ
ncbi:MAG: hypothetical protein ACXVCP_06645 [Bdellovibrio sp.]